MTSRKCNLPALLSIVTLLACFGCAGNKATENEIVFGVRGVTTDIEIAGTMVERFEEMHPDVKVRTISAPWVQYTQKVLTMMAAGRSPDILVLSPSEYADFVDRGVLQSLDPFIEKDEKLRRQLKGMYPELLEAARYHGKLYGIPVWQGSTVLYYNKSLFDKAGVPYPDESWDRAAMLSALKRITGKNKGAQGINVERGIGWFSLAMAWSGVPFLNQEMTACNLNRPEAVRAIEWYYDLADKQGVAPKINENKGAASAELFQMGRMACLMSGSYQVRVLDKCRNLDWGVTLLPRGNDGRNLRWSGPVLFCLASGCRNPQAALEFIRFAGSGEVQELRFRENGDLPVYKDIAGRVLRDKTYGPVFMKSIDGAIITSPMPAYSEIASVAQRRLEEAIYKLPGCSFTSSCGVAAREIDALLAEAGSQKLR
ncbi:MAG: sugar ABC transporter substrate-binding protein [bacterium]|nr:sugar ABC transporter substrate-binding protein [bacterium]